jgi:hypothetical protein
MKPIATPKPEYREVGGDRKELAKSRLYKQNRDLKPYIADEEL